MPYKIHVVFLPYVLTLCIVFFPDVFSVLASSKAVSFDAHGNIVLWDCRQYR